MRFSFLRSKVFLAVAVMVMLVGSALAQSGTSSISGVVSDQSGAVVPGAKVTINNLATGFKRNVTTKNDGSYSFPGIPPATYQLTVEASNFKKAITSGVQALVDSTTRTNVNLEAGAVSETVTVTANTIESVVNTQDASIGNNFVPAQITQLPTNLRRVNDLLSLQPGVTREGYVAGGRSDQSNITLDGVDINNQQNGGRTRQFSTSQGSALRATTESVEEFRITTVNANASQGRSSGAQISLVTRSGSNDFHGAGFYFYRPTAFSANDTFNNTADVERPSLARDIFGGRIGGRIIKDKLFFFYSYEGQRQTLGQSVNRLVPLPHLGQGQIKFSGTGPSCAGGNCTVGVTELNNTIFPIAGINPVSLAVLANASTAYASNNTDTGDGINTGGFRFNAPRDISENTHIARFDYNISESQQLFVRGNYQWDISTGTSQFPDTAPTNLWSHPNGIAVGHNWTISGNKVNNSRYGLTRQSFSNQGDTSNNTITFRFVFAPQRFARTLSRVTDTHNITDDFTWIKGDHTVQFGGNVRIIRNKRNSFGSAFDSASTNPTFYNGAGGAGTELTDPLLAAGYAVTSGLTSFRNSASALIGRYSQYTGNFTFDVDENALPAGTPSSRNFATEEYDAYVQDSWRLFPNLTLTFGLRYSIGRPVYEKNGFQIVPSIPLGDFFDRRVASAKVGIPTNDIIPFVKGGPVNNGPGFYETDKNNWQPRVAAAWSPNFQKGFLHKIFGNEGDSAIRGGFAITNDAFGQQLAVSFDGLSTIGFTSSSGIGFGTYNLTDNLGPRFSGFGQDIRSLPGIPVPSLNFVSDPNGRRIQTSLDATIVSPKHYVANVSVGRSLPKGMYVEASYIYRRARNLGATRDVMAWNNLVDPVSGEDFYSAIGKLWDAREANTLVGSVPLIPFFENLFPGGVGAFGVAPAGGATNAVYKLLARRTVNNVAGGTPVGGFNADGTVVQQIANDWGVVPNMFYHPQYDALTAFGTTAKSDYHGASLSIRQRFGDTLSYDLNYTYSQSKDNASGLQTGNQFGSQFILNSLKPEDNYAFSDFDTRHVINANFIFQLPVGKGKKFFNGVNRLVDALLGGWQLAGVYRWNSGQPLGAPNDRSRWATNWNVQSGATRIRPVIFKANKNTRNAFADPQAAFNSFRNARSGETGERNIFRLPGFQTLDLGLTKNITMPWNENHRLQLRWEVFNVANLQKLAATFPSGSFSLTTDPQLSTSTADPNFGQIFGGIQGSPRSMQFGVRFEF